MKSRIERFEEKISPEPMSGCWLWNANARPDGYGYFWDGQKRVRAHRFSFELYRHSVNDDTHVLHRCDTPACVNPDHLFLGTDADNNADRKMKGRVFRPRGQLSGRALLTEDDVKMIRLDRRASRTVAAAFGITHTQVLYIRRRTSWAWLP